MDTKAESARGGDLRVRKTHKALCDAMYTLLNRRNFNNITVYDLCTEALVSRATFYAHFRDKYDLLEYLLSAVKASLVKDSLKYDELEREVNLFIRANSRLISNIINDANSETLSLVQGFMASVVEPAIRGAVKKDKSPQHIILFNFVAGGLVNLLRWIDKNGYPPDITMMNPYIYKMLEVLTSWDAEQGKNENTGEEGGDRYNEF